MRSESGIRVSINLVGNVAIAYEILLEKRKTMKSGLAFNATCLQMHNETDIGERGITDAVVKAQTIIELRETGDNV
jgi:hypothetical protein